MSDGMIPIEEAPRLVQLNFRRRKLLNLPIIAVDPMSLAHAVRAIDAELGRGPGPIVRCGNCGCLLTNCFCTPDVECRRSAMRLIGQIV